MGLCYVPGCNHGNTPSEGRCRMFTFPQEAAESKRWLKLCRKEDEGVSKNDRICSCHFEDGMRDNGPTIFPWSAEWKDLSTDLAVQLSERSFESVHKMVAITDAITRNIRQMNTAIERMLEDKEMLCELEEMLVSGKSPIEKHRDATKT